MKLLIIIFEKHIEDIFITFINSDIFIFFIDTQSFGIKTVVFFLDDNTLFEQFGEMISQSSVADTNLFCKRFLTSEITFFSERTDITNYNTFCQIKISA
ncbi:MAG: hypothetical protein UH641_02755, partial [Bacteroidales bacterium]|nr:hypothetical protein [Bacteroidales bacterium]